LAEFVRNLPDRVIVYYHNVTPPHFMRGYNDFIESTLAEGRDQTPWFKDAPYAWAASDYNREEMLQMGYRAVDIVPYIVTTTRLDQGVQGSKAQTIRTRFGDGAVNWLFVGRIVPNKRQDNLIRAFHYYHTLVNPNSRLIIVGSVSMAPGFKALLDKLVVDLNLSDCVFFEGPVGPEDGLGAYYQIATAFVCLSEHEGFCVPLLEAMHFDTPVVALKATGVPYALGDAGVLVRNLRFDVIAEVVDALHGDPVFRQRVTAKQRERENDFAPERATAQLHAAISKMCNM
jgi:glycosyltransferase involved in cell wall biosynthesis